MGQVRELFSLNIVGKQLTPFGFSASCGRRRLGRWSELLNRTSKPAKLGAQRWGAQSPDGSATARVNVVSPFTHCFGDLSSYAASHLKTF